MEILFDSKKEECKAPFGCLRVGEACTLRLRVPDCCHYKRGWLVVKNDGGTVLEKPLWEESASPPYTIYKTNFALFETGLYFYYFRIEAEQSTFSLYKRGNGTNMEEGERWQVSCIPEDFRTPDAFKGAVFYQIFPDRFSQESVLGKEEKKTDFLLHEKESDTPHYLPNEHGEILNRDFFGGNLRGIAKKLPYLASLSVSAIYLNPIFEAYSNHRYDTADYLRIDPLLGTEEDFRALCDEAHALGIRVVLDGVFSHTGADSLYFDKKGRYGGGAYHDPRSPYRAWYQFEEYPHRYTSWWGIDTLPAVNELCPSYLDFIILGEDSVVAHWLRAGADGFRLDVADELPDEFIAHLRRRVKEIKPDAIVIGEVWEDASSKVSYGVRRRYFTGGELDSVMNYPFRDAIIAFLRGDISAYALGDTVMRICENYPHDVLLCLLNSLSTHDTPRILTLLADVPTPETREGRAYYRLSPEKRAAAILRLFSAVALQFALPGAPCIYYGDEAGMEGYEDPFNRRFYPWGKADGALIDLYRTLGRLRREHPALRLGECEVTVHGEGALTLSRKCAEETVFFTLARNEPISISAKEILFAHGEEGSCIKNGFAFYR